MLRKFEDFFARLDIERVSVYLWRAIQAVFPILVLLLVGFNVIPAFTHVTATVENGAVVDFVSIDAVEGVTPEFARLDVADTPVSAEYDKVSYDPNPDFVRIDLEGTALPEFSRVDAEKIPDLVRILANPSIEFARD